MFAVKEKTRPSDQSVGKIVPIKPRLEESGPQLRIKANECRTNDTHVIAKSIVGNEEMKVSISDEKEYGDEEGSAIIENDSYYEDAKL